MQINCPYNTAQWMESEGDPVPSLAVTLPMFEEYLKTLAVFPHVM